LELNHQAAAVARDRDRRSRTCSSPPTNALGGPHLGSRLRTGTARIRPTATGSWSLFKACPPMNGKPTLPATMWTGSSSTGVGRYRHAAP